MWQNVSHARAERQCRDAEGAEPARQRWVQIDVEAIVHVPRVRSGVVQRTPPPGRLHPGPGPGSGELADRRGSRQEVQLAAVLALPRGVTVAHSCDTLAPERAVRRRGARPSLRDRRERCQQHPGRGLHDPRSANERPPPRSRHTIPRPPVRLPALKGPWREKKGKKKKEEEGRWSGCEWGCMGWGGDIGDAVRGKASSMVSKRSNSRRNTPGSQRGSNERHRFGHLGDDGSGDGMYIVVSCLSAAEMRQPYDTSDQSHLLPLAWLTRAVPRKG